MLLQNSRPSSDEHRALTALFVKSLGHKNFLNNKMGNTRSLSRTHHDFESVKSRRRLDVKKKHPSSNSHFDDEAIESYADAIASCCSTTAWHEQCHCVRPLSVVLVKTDMQENNNDELVHLTALHSKVSKAEIFDDCK